LVIFFHLSTDCPNRLNPEDKKIATIHAHLVFAANQI
jgi:hypothetical protein